MHAEEVAARMRGVTGNVKVGNDKICVLLYVYDFIVMSESVKVVKRS